MKFTIEQRGPSFHITAPEGFLNVHNRQDSWTCDTIEHAAESMKPHNVKSRAEIEAPPKWPMAK